MGRAIPHNARLNPQGAGPAAHFQDKKDMV
jgi:hypothetical protein